MKRVAIFLIASAALVSLGHAQLALPGGSSSDPAATDGGNAAPVKHRAKHRPRIDRKAPDAIAVEDRPLLLNGTGGQLRLSRGEGGSLKIDKFTLAGEVVSNPTQKCRIDIVGETPITATSQGAPDGLARYTADIPACPLTFDVLDGAVLVPAQNSACVFQAADCQASPGGLWGPDVAQLEGDAKQFAKDRTSADVGLQEALKILQKHDKGAAAALAREQNDFAAQRDDTCHDYVGEPKYGYCASRLTAARAALLRKRTEDSKPKAKSVEGD